MSEFSLKPDVAEDEAHPEEKSQQPPAEAGSLALSADDFSSLEERILRAVTLVKRERQSRLDAEERAAQAEARLREQLQLMENAQKELDALRAERDQVRQRVERLLAQLETLEL